MTFRVRKSGGDVLVRSAEKESGDLLLGPDQAAGGRSGESSRAFCRSASYRLLLGSVACCLAILLAAGVYLGVQGLSPSAADEAFVLLLLALFLLLPLLLYGVLFLSFLRVSRSRSDFPGLWPVTALVVVAPLVAGLLSFPLVFLFGLSWLTLLPGLLLIAQAVWAAWVRMGARRRFSGSQKKSQGAAWPPVG